LQRRVTLTRAEKIRAVKDDNAVLKKQLAEAQGLFPTKLVVSSGSDLLK
jgi:hypothetical protein